MEQKSDATLLKEQLFHNPKNGWQRVDDDTQKEIMDFADGYCEFLGNAKTEREAVSLGVEMLEQAGFTPFSLQKSYRPGDRVYQIIR